MRLMADESIESEGRFGSRRPRFEARAMEMAYGGMVLERLARHTCRIAAVDWACLFVLDRHDPRSAIAAAGCGVEWDMIGTRVGTDEGVVGAVLSSGEPALLEDHRRLIGLLAHAPEGRAGAALPIRFGGRVAGVLCAAAARGRADIDPYDMELLSELADLAGAALDHGRQHRHYDATVHAHVEALAAAMDMRDRRTARHSDDVVELARAVGSILHLEPASLLELEFAARLHDVGKIQAARERGHPLPRHLGLRDARADPGPGGRRNDRPLPPRALGRRRVPRWAQRHPHPAREPDHRGLRRLRRHDQRPAVPGGAAPGRRALGDPSRVRVPVRPGGRPGARRHARPHGLAAPIGPGALLRSARPDPPPVPRGATPCPT
jgi:putative methionine-R-sulfoxide reductase with GAF domain